VATAAGSSTRPASAQPAAGGSPCRSRLPTSPPPAATTARSAPSRRRP